MLAILLPSLGINIYMFVGAMVALVAVLGASGFAHYDEKIRNSRWNHGWEPFNQA